MKDSILKLIRSTILKKKMRLEKKYNIGIDRISGGTTYKGEPLRAVVYYIEGGMDTVDIYYKNGSVSFTKGIVREFSLERGENKELNAACELVIKELNV